MLLLVEVALEASRPTHRSAGARGVQYAFPPGTPVTDVLPGAATPEEHAKVTEEYPWHLRGARANSKIDMHLAHCMLHENETQTHTALIIIV